MAYLMAKRVEQGDAKLKNFVIKTIKWLDLSISVLPGNFNSVPSGEKKYFRPFFSPWLADKKFDQTWSNVKGASTSRVETAYNLLTLLRQCNTEKGEIWECGVYRGATAHLMASELSANGNKYTMRLFDTFSGIPESTEGLDDIRIGDLANTSLMEVKNRVGKHKNLETNYHEGLVPDTFDGLEKSKITFLHIDLDMYVSVRAALDWTYTRLVSGAFVVLDDYGKPGTYGAKKATDEFLADKPESLFFLPTGQAWFIKK